MTRVLDLGAGWSLDLLDGRVTRPGGEERLTDTELRLVRYLVGRAGRPVGRDELEQAVWGYRPGVLTRTVFTTIGRVRQKLEVDPTAPARIVTAPGAGYTWATRAPAPPVAPRPIPASGPLIGREEVLAALLAAVSEARLVSLTGPGGAGKTRLALEVVRRWPGRAVFVPLEPLADAGAVPAAVAEALGEPLGGHDDPWGELAERVGEAALVVLDNAEHLPDLAEPLGRWVGACPGLTVLVTTRVRLRSRAEVTLPLPPLAVPTDGADLARSEAGGLLLFHARRARPGWEPRPAEAEALASLCRALGGNPLALELAAAWLRVLEPAEVAAEVGGGAVLVSLDGDVPERHRSIGATLDASWRLLSPAAARALESLAVCCGPFDRATALAIADADLGTLSMLLDASVLHRAPGDGSAARFHLHPLVRQHAAARLEARGDAAAVRERHARWFLDRLARVLPAALEDERDAARALAPDHEDLLAAWVDRAARAADDAAVGGAALPLYRWLDSTNRFAELGVALREVAGRPSAVSRAVSLLGVGVGLPVPAEVPGGAALVGLPAELRTMALLQAAVAAHRRGAPADAERLAEEALALEPDAGSYLAVFARSVRGVARMWLGRFEAAEVDLAAAAAARRAGRAHSRPAVHLGELHLRCGRPERARDQLEVALAACRQCDDRAFAAVALSRLAQALVALGSDPTEVCLEALEEASSSRLPRPWWSGALAVLGERLTEDPHRAATGVTLLAAAAKEPSTAPAAEMLARLEATRARLPADAWAAAVVAGGAATDAELFARARG